MNEKYIYKKWSRKRRRLSHKGSIHGVSQHAAATLIVPTIRISSSSTTTLHINTFFSLSLFHFGTFNPSNISILHMSHYHHLPLFLTMLFLIYICVHILQTIQRIWILFLSFSYSFCLLCWLMLMFYNILKKTNSIISPLRLF